MKRFNTILIILVIFLKTGNVLSYENIFNVNNIEITKKANISNEDLAKQAIKKAYKDLLEKILLQKDIKKISNLDFSLVKELVSYYQVFKDDSRNNYQDTKVKYNISCGSDSFPKSIEFLLFKHFKNLDSINVKWVSENSQGAKRLTASDSTVGF